MDINDHKKEFERIVKKYNLGNEQKASEIADFLTKNKENKIDLDDFSMLFAMSKEDAGVILSFIVKGLEFKKENIDKK